MSGSEEISRCKGCWLPARSGWKPRSIWGRLRDPATLTWVLDSRSAWSIKPEEGQSSGQGGHCTCVCACMWEGVLLCISASQSALRVQLCAHSESIHLSFIHSFNKRQEVLWSVADQGHVRQLRQPGSVCLGGSSRLRGSPCCDPHPSACSGLADGRELESQAPHSATSGTLPGWLTQLIPGR